MNEIKLNGTNYPFWFSIKAQKELAKIDIDGKDEICFLWLGLKYGAIKEGKEFTLTEEDVLTLFDADVKAYGEACNLLSEQMGKLQSLKSPFDQ